MSAHLGPKNWAHLCCPCCRSKGWPHSPQHYCCSHSTICTSSSPYGCNSFVLGSSFAQRSLSPCVVLFFSLATVLQSHVLGGKALFLLVLRTVNGVFICLLQFVALCCLAAPGVTLSQWRSVSLVGGIGSDLVQARKNLSLSLSLGDHFSIATGKSTGEKGLARYEKTRVCLKVASTGLSRQLCVLRADPSEGAHTPDGLHFPGKGPPFQNSPFCLTVFWASPGTWWWQQNLTISV